MKSGNDALSIDGSYAVGYSTDSITYEGRLGFPRRIDIAIWYPTKEPPSRFSYVLGQQSVSTQIAVDAPVTGGKFPLIVYSHGVLGGGLSSVFICETLAKNGYIVVAPDHTDKFSMSRINGAVEKPRKLKLVRILKYAEDIRTKYLNADAVESRDELSYRPKQVSAALDKALSSRVGSSIDSSRIGAVGHSFGAWTTLCVSGAIPKFHDPRIKASVILSSAVNQNIFSDDELAGIKIPLMFMFGSVEVSQGRGNDRVHLYDPVTSPKYMLEINGADHLTFATGGQSPLRDTNKLKNDKARTAITRYTLAFLNKYLGNEDAASEEQLKVMGHGVDGFIMKK